MPLYVMRNLKCMLDRDSLNKIYISFVRPTLEYSNIVWDNCTQYEINAIERIPIEAARIVTGATSPPVKYFTDRSKAVLLLWIFYVFVLSCICYVLCASVYMCFVVTCWERADLLALVCGFYCEFVTFPLVSWVRCGT